MRARWAAGLQGQPGHIDAGSMRRDGTSAFPLGAVPASAEGSAGSTAGSTSAAESAAGSTDADDARVYDLGPPRSSNA